MFIRSTPAKVDRSASPLHTTRADADYGTDLLAVHDGLPRGLSAADNEAGWRSSLAKLAALVEAVAGVDHV